MRVRAAASGGKLLRVLAATRLACKTVELVPVIFVGPIFGVRL